jgi:thioesterase domain-containing protein/acyl carrier protein
VIGITGIGINDDFFEVGGDSLLGVLIFLQIEEKLKVSLPVTTLLKASTIRSLSILIEKKETEEFFLPYILINPGNQRDPIFFIPGKGGYPTRIKHLQKLLGLDHPVYALQDSRMEKGNYDPHPIRDSATFLYHTIRSLKPSGKVILIGESLGGKIAYEIAQLMLTNKDPLPEMILLDTYNAIPEGSKRPSLKDPAYSGMLIKKHISIWLSSNLTGKGDYIRHYFGVLRYKVRKLFQFKGKDPKKNRGDLFEPFAIGTGLQDPRIQLDYPQKAYPGRVVLFKALRGVYLSDETNGWGKIGINELIIEPIDCYHGSILFEPAVSKLAEKIKKYI